MPPSTESSLSSRATRASSGRRPRPRPQLGQTAAGAAPASQKEKKKTHQDTTRDSLLLEPRATLLLGAVKSALEGPSWRSFLRFWPVDADEGTEVALVFGGGAAAVGACLRQAKECRCVCNHFPALIVPCVRPAGQQQPEALASSLVAQRRPPSVAFAFGWAEFNYQGREGSKKP